MRKEDIERIYNVMNSVDRPMHERTPYYLKAILELLLLMAQDLNDRPKQTRHK